MQRSLALFLTLVLAACSGCRKDTTVHAESRSVAASPELSPAAVAGRSLFFDTGLSASGHQSCATCHSPSHAYAPANARAVQLGGVDGKTAGLRAVPSLRYTLARTPIWAYPRPASLAERVVETDNGPSGGFAWDGRFNTLHEQAAFPLTAPSEMASDPHRIVAAVQRSAYAEQLRQAFGASIFADTDLAFAAILKAIERFELEDASFHPYTSRYDRYLDGREMLTAQEQRGLALFNDPHRGNCAQCHYSARGADGSHPLFTDYQFEVLGVPRNPEIPANRDARFYDLGLCGPVRRDQPTESYCGMFKTPTLRNVAARQAFFHNGRFHTLREALRFYVQRDTNPGAWYPRGDRAKYDDLPVRLRGNVDQTTLPLVGHPGQPPVWNDEEIDAVIAFLKTLDDTDVIPAP